MNWALLGPELDGLEVVLHAPSMSEAPLDPSCSICFVQAHSFFFKLLCPNSCNWHDYDWCWVDPHHPLSL
jgi:hypothetical protein